MSTKPKALEIEFFDGENIFLHRGKYTMEIALQSFIKHIKKLHNQYIRQLV